MRLLPPASAEPEAAAPGEGTRLIRELKGPMVPDLGDKARPVEALPVDETATASGARVHRGPGFGVRRRDRLLVGVAVGVAAVVVLLSVWAVLA